MTIKIQHMKFIPTLILSLFSIVNILAQSAEQSNTVPSEDFWDALTERCGKTYQGHIIKGAKLGDGFTGEKLIMHIRKCDDDVIYIPFNVGDNLSRTWILRKDENGLVELKHDHRHEDGSDDKVTMYGGKSTTVGANNTLTFPADLETQKLIPGAATNIWWMTLDDKVFSYNLRRLGTGRVFTVEFDLSKELPKPKDSWGWEGK